MPSNNVQLVEDPFAAFNAGDLDRAVAGFAADCELVDIATAMTLRGPAGVKQWLQTFRTALPDTHAQLINVVAAGDWVAVEHHGGGTHNGPLLTPMGEVPPSGRKVELDFGDFFQFRDGEIVALHAYYDSATLLRQIGLLG